MRRRHLLLLAAVLACSATAFAQFGGSVAGTGGKSSASRPPMLSPEVVRSFVTIDGTAELRVEPEEIRVVLAVTGEGETAVACRDQVDATIAAIRAAWTKHGIAPENVHADFIAVLPLYEWKLQQRDGEQVGVEKRSGYRMQTNLHVAVADEAVASTALDDAFEQGVTDIIAFDYWSRGLDEAQVEARQKALAAAQAKAKMLLAVFDGPPRVLNVQERTTVHYPSSLYHSFENVHEQRVTQPWRRDVPFIRAHRPRNTYYRGLFPEADVQSPELPMRAEISVVSTVRLYYAAPGLEKPANGK